MTYVGKNVDSILLQVYIVYRRKMWYKVKKPQIKVKEKRKWLIMLEKCLMNLLVD